MPTLRGAWQSGSKVDKLIGFDVTEDHRTYATHGASICPDPELPAYKDRYVMRYPLREWGLDRNACGRIIVSAGLPLPPKSACFFCLAGDTEVLTRNGLKKIKELAGTFSELLVPITNGHYRDGQHGGKTHQSSGRWQSVEVKEFGRQKLKCVRIRRGTRTKKAIRCTAEHRWVLENGSTVTTVDLRPGDALRRCVRPAITCSGSPLRPSAFAVAQGFTFGDGTVGLGDRPARVRFYADKDRAMLRWFSASEVLHDKLPNGGTVPVVSDLPRSWKTLPDIRESRSFLLGWFAGYFAADGTVDKRGSASIEAVKEEPLQFVRDVCQLIGVRCGPVSRRMRIGFNGREPLYRLTVCAADLPASFWLLEHHKQRATGRTRTAKQDPLWYVVRVDDTDDVEEVFCAVVPGTQQFTLADGLVTGNCPVSKPHELAELQRSDPDYYAMALEMERLYRSGRHFRGDDVFSLKARHKTTGEVEELQVTAASVADARQKFRKQFNDTARPYRYAVSVHQAVIGLGRDKTWAGLSLPVIGDPT